MNPAHLHLLLNHLPVLGVGFGLPLLAWAALRRHDAFARLALVVFILSALAAIPTYLSGEPAEEVVEPVAGTIEPWVEPHEEAALVSLVLIETLGLLALGGLWFARRQPAVSRPVLVASLVLALATAGSLAWTANLGGLIRHSEIRSNGAVSADPGPDESQERERQ